MAFLFFSTARCLEQNGLLRVTDRVGKRVNRLKVALVEQTIAKDHKRTQQMAAQMQQMQQGYLRAERIDPVGRLDKADKNKQLSRSKETASIQSKRSLFEIWNYSN